MRLKYIKLSGFKSFVDPTKVILNSNLVSVVGPNGCGKSNIIDAVRWVMGERSPKTLRGESMTDVIFKGSSSRKPLGLASVELVFDNSDSSLLGEYASYQEIAVRRQVTQDGQSAYYLNNTKCRSKDIKELFMGTGLGSRSYSIIEQGMISRMIEAKPEELRIYLEEAAGVSQYKARRRETETRIRHTHENLNRINDIRDELEKQLNHLQRQAKAAERFKVLKAEEAQYKSQWIALRWQDLDAQITEQNRTIDALDLALEAEVTDQNHLVTKIEQSREEQITRNETFNAVQKQYYALGAEIARIEQSIQHQKERREQLLTDQSQTEQQFTDLTANLQNDQQHTRTLREQVDALQPQLEKAKTKMAQEREILQQAEEDNQAWQEQWEAFNQRFQQASRQVDVNQTHIQHLQERMVTLIQRCERLQTERQVVLEQPQSHQASASGLQADIDTLDQDIAGLQSAIQEDQQQIARQRETNKATVLQLDEEKTELQNKRGRRSSLEAFQEAALGKRDDVVVQWLNQQNLATQSRLAERLSVSSGWEVAVEMVLGSQLEAVCVDDFDHVFEKMTTAMQSLTQGHVSVLQTGQRAGSVVPDPSTLASKVAAPFSLDSLLEGIYATDTLEQAIAKVAILTPRESVICKEGIWLGKGWVRVIRGRDEKRGVLQREQELKSLTQAIDTAADQVETLASALQSGRECLQTLEANKETHQQQANEKTAARSDLQAQLRVHQARITQCQQRADEMASEIQDSEGQVAKLKDELNTTQAQWQTVREAVDAFELERVNHLEKRDRLRTRLANAKQQVEIDYEILHGLTVQLETAHAQLDATVQNHELLQKQLQDLQARRERLQQAIEENNAPVETLARDLEASLAGRMTVETELTQARQAVQNTEASQRELEQRRQAHEETILEKRNALESQRMHWQALEVRRNTLKEQLDEMQVVLTAVLSEIPEEADEQVWEEHLQRLATRIQRLGAINLAAIEEYDVQAERKTYLDKQHEDLAEALQTLENAIRKIDTETRTRFKETYDTVNESFQRLFPKVFGGGSAYLELTGDDLLDTGITVFARPPGKRNSTIHLLSGGEKALTAIALVFSIFQLNPAPFCLLDEVDAPLDDANVGRYCQLVKEMSEHVQFIFITHNKVTMEMAKQLIGVTMNEPGVSRLVAVDVEQAAALAEA